MKQTAGLTNKFCRLGLRLEKYLKGGPSVRAIIRQRQSVARRMLPSLLSQDSPLTQELQQSSSPNLRHPCVDCTCSNRLLFHLFQDPRGAFPAPARMLLPRHDETTVAKEQTGRSLWEKGSFRVLFLSAVNY
ncbi:hypothetical protein L596_025143 [Steinernema carpocapsae]|uniref:Uncharacterized protein n=1 Tax=Steinernema carpocapsae TaxID=34508 RepID=A0A4U5M6Y5_STECR|nr:hypothetical protein L596_025143 [Steinernema carpocapsae]